MHPSTQKGGENCGKVVKGGRKRRGVADGRKNDYVRGKPHSSDTIVRAPSLEKNAAAALFQLHRDSEAPKNNWRSGWERCVRG